MLVDIYIEALLVDEEAADAVWEAWDRGELTTYQAGWIWWHIGSSLSYLIPGVLQAE